MRVRPQDSTLDERLVLRVGMRVGPGEKGGLGTVSRWLSGIGYYPRVLFSAPPQSVKLAPTGREPFCTTSQTTSSPPLGDSLRT